MTNSLYVNELERKVQQLQQELDEIKSVEFPRRVEKVAEGWRGKCEHLQEYLEASQAREAQLREAFGVIEKGACLLNMPRIEMQTVARAVLAIPHDDTALRERLKAERERCAKVCDVLTEEGFTTYAAAREIRNLGDE